MPLYFLYHLIQFAFPRLEAVATGSTFKEITKGALGQLEFPIPPTALIQKFELAVAPVMELVLTLGRQSQNLSSTHDLLLPRLISGELSVAAANRELEAA